MSFVINVNRPSKPQQNNCTLIPMQNEAQKRLKT